jgi:hypothetical protein
MSRMAHGGLVQRVDCEGDMEQTEQIQLSLVSEPSEAECLTWIWRLDQLIGLGFDSARAAQMADDVQVDLAQARRLVALGCPLETAARILL